MNIKVILTIINITQSQEKPRLLLEIVFFKQILGQIWMKIISKLIILWAAELVQSIKFFSFVSTEFVQGMSFFLFLINV